MATRPNAAVNTRIHTFLRTRFVRMRRVMAHLGLDFYSDNLQSLGKNLFFHTVESLKYPKIGGD